MTSLHVWSESITTFLHISIVSLSFLSLLVIHLIPFASYSLLTVTHLGFDTSHHHYTYHYRFILRHLSPYRYHVHVRHSQVHGSWGSPYMLHFIYMRARVLIIGYLSLVSFHFYHPITLAYVTSRVLRPPWGHGIRCRLRQPLLGQVIEIWLMFRYRHASSSGSRLFDV